MRLKFISDQIWLILVIFLKFEFIEQLEFINHIGTNGVRDLRRQKLSSGLPFMINSSELSSSQCYLEFSNGSIKLVRINISGNDFDTIRELTSKEANALRHRFNISKE